LTSFIPTRFSACCTSKNEDHHISSQSKKKTL